MQIDILTLFPEMFDGVFSESIIKRAVENNKIKINIHKQMLINKYLYKKWG